MAGTMLFRKSPPFVGQINVNSCWAAALEMWFNGELGYGWTQTQLLNSAGDFSIGPGGINLSGLQQVIDDATGISTIKMYTQVVQSSSDVPKIADIISEVGYLYLAYTRPDGLGGHVNVLTGFSGNSYAAMDPDPVSYKLPDLIFFTSQCSRHLWAGD